MTLSGTTHTWTLYNNADCSTSSGTTTSGADNVCVPSGSGTDGKEHSTTCETGSSTSLTCGATSCSALTCSHAPRLPQRRTTSAPTTAPTSTSAPTTARSEASDMDQ